MRNKRVKVLALALALIMVLGMVIVPETAKADGKTEIKIIHVNDVHGNAETDLNDKGEGSKIGYAKLKTFVENVKAENPNTLVLDAGDTIHGTTFATISRGQSMVDLMAEIGFDFTVPGNHDFNYGIDRLLELKKADKVKILSANVVKEADGSNPFDAYAIKEVGGVKVGIFGLSTPETKTKSNPLNTEGYEFKGTIEVAKEMVAKLKEEGAEVIIALAHLGLDEESTDRSDLVAENVEGIDLIVDGHSHTKLDEGKLVKETLIAQTGEHLKNIGVVTLEVEGGKVVSKKAELVEFEAAKEFEANEAIVKGIEKVNEENKPFLETVIGKTEVELNGEREFNRKQETNLGNLITDAMLEATESDVAITNGGGIRASIKAGDVKMGDVLLTFPFANYPVKIEVKGSAIVEALEHGIKSYPELAGGFPQVAGMTFKFDEAKEAGNRVFEVKVGGELLDPEKTYTLVTNDFMAIGGDGYEMFKGAKVLAEYPLLSEVLAEYIKEKGTINPVVEGRIVVETAPAVEEVPEEKPAEEKPVEEKPVEEHDSFWLEMLAAV
ncbi:MAG: bifunctional metallophosphatase/5'-nucleotidase [Tissierellia bacterium]|nr:bifunctional metallophosphatase/5'-nucleotidase [Tissierellia bacterium]